MGSQPASLPNLPAGAVRDELFDETELGSIENHKDDVLRLLSQTKVGMDLTKVECIPGADDWLSLSCSTPHSR